LRDNGTANLTVTLNSGNTETTYRRYCSNSACAFYPIWIDNNCPEQLANLADALNTSDCNYKTVIDSDVANLTVTLNARNRMVGDIERLTLKTITVKRAFTAN
jgi:hypothetical protein